MNLFFKKATVFATAASIFFVTAAAMPCDTLNFHFTANAADSVAINATNFPDENFRNYLQENFDTDSSGGFSESEIANIKNIDIESSEISSIKGIEFFTSLTNLDTFNNPITAMDLSKNTKLKTLTCSSNELTQLDVSNNTALTYLSCASNSLTALDVSKNTLLEDLYCYSNQLTTIDVSKNTLLDTLYCNGNQLTSINVSNNTLLTDFKCSSNQIPSLDLSNCTKLYYLYCNSNLLTSLDISNLAKLYYLDCTNNAITNCDFTNNTDLELLYCGYNQLASLDLSNNVKLKYLYCESNLLTKLDLSNNAKLKTVRCIYNQITDLDLSNCTLLEYLYCSNNNIEKLQLADCTSLKYLSFYSNILTELDISKNTLLQTLYCQWNSLDAIDVSHNTELQDFNCSRNQLTVLDISNNTNLKSLDCSNNQLTSLDVSNCANLSTVYCSSNKYDIGKIGETAKTFDLNNLPEGFDIAKASNWQGATYENGMLTNIEGVNGYNIKYTYDIGNGITKEFSLSFAYRGEITYQYLSLNTEEETYFADNTETVVHHYAFLHYIFPELEEGTFAMLITDFCDITTIVSPDSSLDVANTSSSSATEEYVSPFDLYWSARNAGITECEFVYTYRMDMSKIDALFNRINARTGYGLSYQENFDLFVNILYDENGNAIELGSQTVNVAQRGDANLDHSVDTRDAASIAKYCSLVANGTDNPEISADNNELAKFASDVNGDGIIDTRDAANVSKYASIKANDADDISEAEKCYTIWSEMQILN